MVDSINTKLIPTKIRIVVLFYLRAGGISKFKVTKIKRLIYF
ncbi:hypothetical protein AsAng_0006580 [Aureispira anguillae]|uniref:Uncharacterized protein n=1 Tax=Aureispira anguillae TaxID=2864201 RepID=A0A915YBC9_9BACT|nr:hypothetical protein AsAng_0006580 [Aureispira anguillae]